MKNKQRISEQVQDTGKGKKEFDKCDFCRTAVINYTKTAGGQRLDKPKLNYRFHHTESPQKLAKVLVRICIEANMIRVENAIREEISCAIDEAENKEKEKSEQTDGFTEDYNEYSGIL